MKSFFSWSIRTHLLILVTLAMIPSLAMVLLSGLKLRSQAMEEAGNSALGIERTMAFHQERVAENTRQLLMTLAKLPAVRDRDRPESNAILKSLLAQNPCCVNLLVADTRGDVFASGLPANGINIADRAYFREALTTGNFTVGRFTLSRSAGIPVIHYAYPVTDTEGRMRAVTIAAFDLSSYGRLLSASELPPGSALALSDSTGTRLYRYPDSEKYFGVPDLPEMTGRMAGASNEGIFMALGVDGVVRLYAFRRLDLDGKGHNLFIRVGIPATAVAAAERSALTRNLTLMGAATLLALLFAWLLGDVFFVRRLIRLVDASARLGRGELNARSGIPHGDGEIGRLAGSFDAMAAALEKREMERLQAEEALMESEKRLKLVIQGSNDGFWDWHVRTGEVRHSDRWAEMLGYLPDEIAPNVGAWKSLVHPEDMPAAMQVLREHLDGLRSQYRIEYRMRHKSGKWVWILDRGKVVEWDEHGKPLRMSGTATDIAERKQMEEERKALEGELLHAQKMEAIGQFAGGIAHDFSNVLTAVTGFATVLRARMEQDELSRQYADEILLASERGTALTRSILGFSRKQPLNREPLNLDDLIYGMEKLMQHLVGDEVEIGMDLATRNTFIKADGRQLEQVLMNLAANARDAMPEGGVLSLRTETRDPGACPAAGCGMGSSQVVLTVSDTGCGMDSATLEKIFEPFFTTKEAGTGTGLGLAMVSAIVRQHGGRISVSSAPGRGTSFHVCFPIHQDAISPAGPGT